MKTFYSCLLILTFFTSCTNDSSIVQEADTSTIAYRAINEVEPLRTENPYDFAGMLHDELFETYYASGNLPRDFTGIINRVELIASTNTVFNEMTGLNYKPVTPARIQYILEQKNTIVSEIIASSSMTLDAKSSLTDFINALVLLFPTEFNADTLSDFVIKYETTVLANPSFTVNDKRIILITTSIARHSTCMARRKPKKNTDPDWIVFVGNIIAATEGSEESSAKAVTMALVSGIAQN